MSGVALNPYQQFLDDAGIPVQNGTLTFYENTTTTLDTIYTDNTETVAQSNPYTLDASGRMTGDVWYTGVKTMKLEDEGGAEIRTLDDVSSLEEIYMTDIASGVFDMITVTVDGGQGIASVQQNDGTGTIDIELETPVSDIDAAKVYTGQLLTIGDAPVDVHYKWLNTSTIQFRCSFINFGMSTRELIDWFGSFWIKE